MAAFPNVGDVTRATGTWTLIVVDITGATNTTANTITWDDLQPIVISPPLPPQRLSKRRKPPWPLEVTAPYTPPPKTPGIRLAKWKDYQCRRL